MDAVKILTSLLGSNATGGSLLGKMMGGGGSQSSGGIGSLLGALTGGRGGGGLTGMLLKGAGGAMLGKMLGGGGAPVAEAAPEPSPAEANDQAAVLIRAMCNAAKADGEIDETEQQNIISKLGEIDQAEADFLRQ